MKQKPDYDDDDDDNHIYNHFCQQERLKLAGLTFITQQSKI